MFKRTICRFNTKYSGGVCWAFDDRSRKKFTIRDYKQKIELVQYNYLTKI